MAQWQPTDEELVQTHDTDKMVNRYNRAILIGIGLGMLLGAFWITIVLVALPGDIVYIQATPAPPVIATPMDVILNMRDREGKNAEKWVCKYGREQGWLCEPMEEGGNHEQE